MLGIGVLLTFLAAVLLALGAAFLWSSMARAPIRLMRNRLLAATVQPGTSVHLFRDERMSSVPVLESWLIRSRSARTLKRYLDQAAIQRPVGVVLGITLLLAFLGAYLGRVVMASWLWAAVGAGLLGSLVPLYVRRRRRHRLGLYAAQLPEALDVLNRALRVGQSFLQGVQTVAREMPEPTATEFRLTFEALRLGHPLREVIRAHAERVENLDFNLFATALLVQREVGGNLTEILEHSSETIRERYKLLGQVSVLSAQNRLASKVVGALPFVVGGLVAFIHPELMSVLLKEPVGRTFVAVALMLQLLGFYLMKRITTIEV